MSKLDVQRDAEPHLVADIWLYETANGGRAGPALPGFGCLLIVSKEQPISGWDSLLLLRDQPLHPGERRRIGFAFLSPEQAVPALAEAGHFYLWDGRIIGEGSIAATDASTL
ncbi:hypothetical protein ATB93_07950 [Sphingomonas sp. WG]|nr:hypothetical protein ATB93_07950 [Sphingomonas sp. WG]